MPRYASKSARRAPTRSRAPSARPRRAASSGSRSRGTVSRRGGNVVRVVLEAPRAAPTMNAMGRMVEAVIPGKAKF